MEVYVTYFVGILSFLSLPQSIWSSSKYTPVTCCISIGDFIPDAIDRCFYWRCVYTGEVDRWGNYLLKPQKKDCPHRTRVFLTKAIGPSSPFVEWVHWYVKGRHQGICGGGDHKSYSAWGDLPCVRTSPLPVHTCEPVQRPASRCYDCTYEVGLNTSFQACNFSDPELVERVATPGCRSGDCFIRRVHDDRLKRTVITRGCVDLYYGQQYKPGCVSYQASVPGVTDVRIYCKGDLCNDDAQNDSIDPVSAKCNS